MNNFPGMISSIMTGSIPAHRLAVHRAYLGKGSNIIRFQYNPPSFTDTQGVNYAEIKSLGISYPILQYVGGVSRTIQFDIYVNGAGGDGWDKPFNDLKRVLDSFMPKKGTQFQAPQSLIFAFGPFVQECLFKDYTTKYTNFSPDLRPLEATFTVNLYVVQS